MPNDSIDNSVLESASRNGKNRRPVKSDNDTSRKPKNRAGNGRDKRTNKRIDEKARDKQGREG